MHIRCIVVALALLGAGCGPDLTPTPGPVVRLTTTPTPSQTFLNNAKCVAVDGSGRIHVVWLEILQQGSDGQALLGQLFHSRSVDGGQSFSTPVPLTAMVTKPWSPKVAAVGDALFVTWHQEDAGFLKIFFALSEDGGARFTTLASPLGNGAFPALAAVRSGAAAAKVHVVWQDPQRPSGISEIFIASSLDGGHRFSSPAMVSADDGRSSWTTTVAAADQIVHVAWTDERHDIDPAGMLHDCGAPGAEGTDCHEEEYYRRSTDDGVTFSGPEVRLTADPTGQPQSSWCPSVAASGSDVHLTYFDLRSGSWEVYHRRSRDAGVTWEAESSVSQLLDHQPAGSWIRPSLALMGNALQLAFWRPAADSENAWTTASQDGGATWSKALLISGPGRARHCAVTLASDGTPHFAWYELADGNDEMFYRHLESAH